MWSDNQYVQSMHTCAGVCGQRFLWEGERNSKLARVWLLNPPWTLSHPSVLSLIVAGSEGPGLGLEGGAAGDVARGHGPCVWL